MGSHATAVYESPTAHVCTRCFRSHRKQACPRCGVSYCEVCVLRGFNFGRYAFCRCSILPRCDVCNSLTAEAGCGGCGMHFCRRCRDDGWTHGADGGNCQCAFEARPDTGSETESEVGLCELCDQLMDIASECEGCGLQFCGRCQDSGWGYGATGSCQCAVPPAVPFRIFIG